MDWIDLVQYGEGYEYLVNAEINFRVP